MTNIVLIGMPACGKSTLGKCLAKAFDMNFLDTDTVIETQNGMKLQAFLDQTGIDGFLKEENDVVASLTCSKTVIAPGGSVVYGKQAMAHMHEIGVVVYIKLPFEEIERRLSNLSTRGVTLRPGQTLRDLYDERIPLYEAEADIVFDANDADVMQTAEALTQMLRIRMEQMHVC